ncbi:hypothetical protein R6Q59_026673 [Mikania micrantha]
MRTTLDDSFINDDDTEDDDENASTLDEENEIDVDDDEDDDIVDICYSRMTTYIARGHGKDGGDRPPHGDPKRLFKGCESCYEDVEKARTKPPEELDQQAWEQLINQLFLNPDFRKRSEKNKLNRSKQRYTSFHGSKSYAQRRHMEGTGGIEVFKETHYKAGEGWVNEIAESNYDIMQEDLKRCGDSESVNQIECMERALGQRRGHIRGVGRVVRHPTPDVSSTYHPQQGEWQNQMDERVEQLQQQLQQQQERDR